MVQLKDRVTPEWGGTGTGRCADDRGCRDGTAKRMQWGRATSGGVARGWDDKVAPGWLTQHGDETPEGQGVTGTGSPRG